MGETHVEVSDLAPDAGAWESLLRRAPANVFMDPIAVKAASAARLAKIRNLVVWLGAGTTRSLVGVWAFQEARALPFWPGKLTAPPYEYAFLSTPIVDPAYLDDVVAAFFDAIESDPALPNVVRIKALDAENGFHDAIVRVLAIRGRGRQLALSEWERPFVSREAGAKRSGSTRKKLRQDWNRLTASGRVEFINVTSASAVPQAFETFLRMEAGSWKGTNGTALLCLTKHAEFARRLIRDLSCEGKASIALLCLDGEPIAAQVLLYCGRTAFTWKTAYRAQHGKFSPGTLLVDRVSEVLLAGGAIDEIESCSSGQGFMAQLWPGRRKTVDVLIDVAAARSVAFTLAAAEEGAHAHLRRWRAAMQARAPLIAGGLKTPRVASRTLALP